MMTPAMHSTTRPRTIPAIFKNFFIRIRKTILDNIGQIFGFLIVRGVEGWVGGRSTAEGILKGTGAGAGDQESVVSSQ